MVVPKLGPIELPNAYLASVNAKVAYWGLLFAAGSIYTVGLGSRRFSLPIIAGSIFLSWLSGRQGVEAWRQSSWVNKWMVVASDRFEDNIFQAMESNKPLPIAPAEPTEAPIKTAYPDDVAESLDSNSPHLMILGETGSGKSFTAEAVINHLEGQLILISPHYQIAGDGEKEDFPTKIKAVGRGRDFDSIEAETTKLIEELDRRACLTKAETNRLPWLNYAIDELPAIGSNCKEATKNILAILREARKFRIRLIVMAQSDQVAALGIEGQGKSRANYRVIRLGSEALAEAKRIDNEPLIKLLNETAYPALYEGAVLKLTGTYTSVSTYAPNASGVSLVRDTTKGFQSLPSYLTPDTVLTIVDEITGGKSVSAAIESNGMGGRRYSETKGFLIKEYPHLFNDEGT